ncbi:MAG: SycD/LcrH family type III secretion system chaperone [Chlamydiales bacterium]
MKKTAIAALLGSANIQKKANLVLKRMKEENISLKEAAQVNDHFLEEVYSLAHAHYERGNYKESLSLFQLLSGIAPSTHKYVFGLSANFHQMGKFEDAMYGFYLALNIDPENPIPAFYIADCLLKLNFKAEAEEFLNLTIEIAVEKPQYAEMKHKSLLMLNTLKEGKQYPVSEQQR